MAARAISPGKGRTYVWQRLRDTGIDYNMILRERRLWLLSQDLAQSETLLCEWFALMQEMDAIVRVSPDRPISTQHTCTRRMATTIEYICIWSVVLLQAVLSILKRNPCCGVLLAPFVLSQCVASNSIVSTLRPFWLLTLGWVTSQQREDDRVDTDGMPVRFSCINIVQSYWHRSTWMRRLVLWLDEATRLCTELFARACTLPTASNHDIDRSAYRSTML